jgi:hypothetical protein
MSNFFWQTSSNSILEEFFLVEQANFIQFLLVWGIRLVVFGTHCKHISSTQTWHYINFVFQQIVHSEMNGIVLCFPNFDTFYTIRSTNVCIGVLFTLHDKHLMIMKNLARHKTGKNNGLYKS